MKIAVSATGGSLNAQVSSVFARCAYFVIVDSETMKFEIMQNPAEGMMGGAGPEAARQINDRGCRVVITGQVGPNAQRALESFGIEVVTGATGTVKEAVENYLKQK
ncbi:MAG: NifB/NifX family molybdenum-iron cluster-binding protein [Elusimicrobia bacterium]|nr:NifB/NifX family molybdenum-iron cluster-binding protein [Elusimicrobiota bacterium]